jgi:signal transduction histidine kinase
LKFDTLMKFKKIFNPNHWTSLSKQGGIDNDNLRRDILFSQILVVGLIISVFHFSNDLYHGNAIAYYLDSLFVLTLGVFYYLNEKGAHKLAKFLHLTSLNILIFLLAGILEPEVRMQYNFFPMVILAFLVFYKTELIWSISFSIISFLLVLVLEVTDYMPFGEILIKQGVDSVTLFINIIGAFILLVMGLVFLVRLNYKAESELLKSESHLRKTNEELDRFVYSASHDLRAPLLSIKGLTNLMKKEKAGTELKQCIENDR